MTAETFAVVRLSRPRALSLVSSPADQFAADLAYQFAKLPAVLVRLGRDCFAALVGKAVETRLGADPQFSVAIVAEFRGRQPRPLLSACPRPGSGTAKRDRR